jgi:hypothetical protein
MFKKLAAALLLVGLVLPYSCGVAPLVGVWDDVESALMVGIPVIMAVAFALHTVVPALARFHERNGPALHGLLRVIYLVLAGMYAHAALKTEEDAWPFWVAALVVTGSVLYWSQGRGTKAQRLPLLLLAIAGLPTVAYFASGIPSGGLEVGAWVFTAGWLLAVGAEVNGLRGKPQVSHGG